MLLMNIHVSREDLSQDMLGTLEAYLVPSEIKDGHEMCPQHVFTQKFHGPDIMRSASALARVSASRSLSAFACASADCKKTWKPSITCSSERVCEVSVGTGIVDDEEGVNRWVDCILS